MNGGIPPLNGFHQRYRGIGSGGGGSDGSLGDTVASCVWDLDATISDSYDGSSQTWYNLRATPADGESQSQYNYYRGASSSSSTDDPTFTGSAGSSSAYFALDSGDFFTPVSATIPTFVKNLHKTTGGSTATIILCMQTGASGYFWGTGPSSPGSVHGIYFYKNGSTGLLVDQFGTSAYGRTSTTITAHSTPVLLAVAFDYTNDIFKVASNARTFSTTTIVKVTSTTDATNTMKIGANGASAKTGGSFRLYGCYGFNTVLTNAELDDLVDVLNTRHGRTYA